MHFIGPVGEPQRPCMGVGVSQRKVIGIIRELFQAIWDMGYEAFERLWRYFVLGAVLVVPIWLIVRLVRAPRGR